VKTRTVIERIGERMGDIDYAFDFRSRYENCCTSSERRDEMCAQDISRLRELEHRIKAGESLDIRDGEWWYHVIDVGMYDGWPYWKPTPAVFVVEPVMGGGTWKFWYNIDEIRTAK
jgi:hypothetical protein